MILSWGIGDGDRLTTLHDRDAGVGCTKLAFTTLLELAAVVESIHAASERFASHENPDTNTVHW